MVQYRMGILGFDLAQVICYFTLSRTSFQEMKIRAAKCWVRQDMNVLTRVSGVISLVPSAKV